MLRLVNERVRRVWRLVKQKILTDKEALRVQALLSCMLFGSREHALDTLAVALLAELHLQNSHVDGLAGYLVTELVKLAV